jgi:hypothetical protein
VLPVHHPNCRPLAQRPPVSLRDCRRAIHIEHLSRCVIPGPPVQRRTDGQWRRPTCSGGAVPTVPIQRRIATARYRRSQCLGPVGQAGRWAGRPHRIGCSAIGGSPRRPCRRGC